MVTTNIETSRTFTLRISRGKDHSIRAAITNDRAETRHYEISLWRVAFFTQTNTAVRDAVDFLLGDASA